MEKMLNLDTGLVDLNHSFSTCWHAKGLSASGPPKMECVHFESRCDEGSSTLKVESRFLALSASNGQALMSVTTDFKVQEDAVEVSFLVEPMKVLRNLPSLPRIGCCFALKPELYHITYFGRGAHENYPDKKSSAQMGLWSTTPTGMHVDYVVPSENGNSTDVRWVSFLNNKSEGLLIVSKEGFFCFSASLLSQEELHKANHTSDLESRCNGESGVYVNLDHALMGVGGDVG